MFMCTEVCGSLDVLMYPVLLCVADGVQVMKDVQYRVEWARFQDREKKKEEDAVEKERGEIIIVGLSHPVPLLSEATNIFYL